MDTARCEALIRSIDLGSFSAAAKQLGYTPSGITRMVNALEAELGVTLVMRTKHGITPTSEGAQLLPALRESLRCDERIRQISGQVRGIDSGELTIGTYFSISASWMPTILKTFQRQHPGIRVTTLQGGNSDLVRLIDERKADCCFMSKRRFNGDWVPLRDDPLVAWLPADHPRAHDAAFPLNEFDGAPFINTLPGEDSDIDQLFEGEGIIPDIRFSNVDNYASYAMVEAGLGISLNNLLMSRRWSGNVAVLPLDPPRHIQLGIAVPSLADCSPALHALIECSKRILAAETA